MFIWACKEIEVPEGPRLWFEILGLKNTVIYSLCVTLQALVIG